jgi:hypothetical protein
VSTGGIRTLSVGFLFSAIRGLDRGELFMVFRTKVSISADGDA